MVDFCQILGNPLFNLLVDFFQLFGRLFGRLLVNFWSTFCRILVDFWSTFGRLLVDSGVDFGSTWGSIFDGFWVDLGGRRPTFRGSGGRSPPAKKLGFVTAVGLQRN